MNARRIWMVGLALLVSAGLVYPVLALPDARTTAAPGATEGPQPLADGTAAEAPRSPPPGTQEEGNGAQANRRLALHVTEAELFEWRRRAQRGPYRTVGDVSRNSPGDWTRMTANAEAFLDDANASRWRGPTRNNPGGCVQQDGGDRSGPEWRPPLREADQLRDAAFVALVNRDRPMAVAVLDEMLAQAGEQGVDFTDRGRWCEGVILDVNPGFSVANWLTKYLFAASYIEAFDADLIRRADRERLERWFAAGAEWMRHDIDLKLDALFVDRPSGDYSISDVAEAPTEVGRVAYFGGPEVLTLHRRWNNRNARQARYVTLVGIWVEDDDLIDFGKTYVKDALRYSYFPQGAVGDFERWTRRNPTKGWKYGGEFVGALVTIADHLARAGDDELYEFSTTDGALGTEGVHELSGLPKSLHTLVRDIMSYVDHTYERYGTDRRQQAGRRQYLIDSVNQLKEDPRITDTALAMANHHFDDPYIRAVYTREADGTPPYPADPGEGRGEAASGEGGVYPGVLFMFGDMEDRQVATGPLPLANG